MYYNNIILYCIFSIFAINNRFYAQNIIVKPYLQDATQQSVVVMWEVDEQGRGFIDFGNNPFTLNQSVSSSDVVGNGNTRIHSVSITGLLPNTKYYYRVRMFNGITSAVYHFKTLPEVTNESTVDLIAISDMQRDGSNPNVFKTLVEQGIVVVCDTILENGFFDLEGILIPGDLVQNGGTYQTWRTDFFNLCDSITPYVPLYPVLGNHEYYSGGFPNFIKYFTMPQNGTASNPDEWWYKDISNIRIIGLNSNSGSGDLNKQLLWLDTILLNAGQNDNIDFVFAQMHHPYKSELWTPGELDFTGDIVAKMELFSTTFHKPSIHFFGHTHAYSRGVSRDHNHFWINVATAGGAIDNWGEFPNADYDEFTISEDEYGFVLIEVEAGHQPKFRIRRFSRGDQSTSENNTLSDEFTVFRFEHKPEKPIAIYPSLDSISISCVKLKASKFNDPENTHQASQWQIANGCDFQNQPIINSWKQSENWYNEVNTQANDDLTDEVIEGLLPNSNYCWRVRYRDNHFNWSEWSEPKSFFTKTGNNVSVTSNLLLNHGAENGIQNWTGQIESLTSNECNSVPVYAGLRFFAVGGVCANESNVGFAQQDINVNPYASAIDSGLYSIEYSAFMRAYATNNDSPEMYIEFLNGSQQILSTSNSITNATAIWTNRSSQVLIPVGTRTLRIVLKGTRNSGSDNDSYFDNLEVKLINQQPCITCIGSQDSNLDADGDGFCANIDCDDNNAIIHPGQIESCDNIDNNCDGFSDSGDEVIWEGGVDLFWNNDQNWNQNINPLVCQHVILGGNDTVLLVGRAYINSLEVLANATLQISEGAELIINGNHDINQASALIEGTLINYGKIIIKNSVQNGLIVNGSVENGRDIEINQILLQDIKIMDNSSLENLGTIRLK